MRRRITLTARGRVVYLVAAAVACGIVSYASCTTYVRPFESGIKQVMYGPGAGIKPELYGPGLHWVLWGTEKMHRFPRDVQTLSMVTEDLVAKKADTRFAAPLNIQTSEGYNVTV